MSKVFIEKISNIIGIWKFSEKITLEQLQEIAKEWAKDSKYLSIHIRSCSKKQLGIGFEYDLEKNNPKAFERYFDDTSDFLKRKTGNSYIGFDFSSYYYKIK